MKIIKLVLLAQLVLVNFNSFSQKLDWRNYNSESHQNFFAIQAAFEADMGDVPYEKGKGIKQFRRWEYYWESRVNPDGTFPAPGNVMQEMLQYKSNHPVMKSYVNGSGTWSLIGPEALPSNLTGQLNGNGRLNCIAFHPVDTNVIYVGAASGGLWKTTDHGATWTEYSVGLVRLGISSIVIHPTQPDTMYIGTGDRDGNDAPGYGVWRSVDGGQTWASHNSGMGNKTVNEIIMNPNHADSMVAATNNYIYRTTDGGATWLQSNNLGMNPKDIAMHPTNPLIVYASGDEYHKSSNGGQTFIQVSSNLPSNPQRMALAVSADEPNWVYILAGGGNGLIGIYKSTNSGATFTNQTSSPNILGYSTDGSGNGSQAWYDLVLVADPLDANIIYTGGVNIWKSTDGGVTMNCSSYWVGTSGSIDGVHADQHALEFSPHNNILYNGNDGGIYYTLNGGTDWTDISSGLAIAQIYKIGVSAQTSEKVITGFQDNGTGFADGNGNFFTIIGGDGMECIIDPTDDDYMYGALYYGDIRRSANGGNNFTNISNSIPEDGNWVTPYKLDPNNENTMIVGMEDVWRNVNVKNNDIWTSIGSFAGNQTIRDLAIAPSNSDVIYVSRRDNKLWKSTNATSANPTWTDLGGNLPLNNEPADIEIDPLDSEHLFIALNGNIYESSNGGTSWVDISGTLPNISLNTIVIDYESTVGAMYVGMDVGVYYKDDNLTDWVTYQTNLPNVEVTELEIQYDAVNCDGKILAGTYGQGVWVSDLKDPGNVAPIACFDASGTSVCAGTEVSLTDKSSFTPTSWSWTITPATVQYVNGSSATSQHPDVLINTPGTYTVSLTATNATGADSETKTSFITVGAADDPCDYNEDFEAESTCGTANDCGSTLCPLSSFWTNLNNGSEDDIDWRVDNGGTNSTNTGPSADNTTGTATGKYVYLEASSGCIFNTAILASNCIQLNQAYNFSFAYHMYGGNTGELHVDLYHNDQWQQDIIPAIIGDQGNQWNMANIDLSAYQGQSVKLRIRGITGSGYESDIAIDDLSFTPMAGTPIPTSTCVNYTSPSGNYIWSTTGIYTDTLTAQSGCDSIVSIDLTILPPDATTENVTACASYTWPANGTTYTNAGTYTAVLTNQAGCDSTVTLNLAMSTIASSSQNVSTCNSYTWGLNGQTYTSSGAYSETVLSSSGCDSTVTLNLSINQPTSSTQVVNQCNSYTWAANGQTYTSSGNYTTVIPNSTGCDSTITLDLTISNATQTNLTETACGSYTWTENNQTYTNSGSYSEMLTSSTGCDSLVVLDLEVNPAYNITESITSCGDFMWSEDGQTYPTSGVFTVTYTSQYGCDSIRTLDLVVDDLEAVYNEQNEITFVTFASTGYDYQWVDCNDNYSPIAGETGATFVATQNGSYALIATNGNCADTSECFAVTTIGLDEFSVVEYEIFPNPVQESLTVQFGQNIENLTLKIYDARGALVATKSFSNTEELKLDFPYAKGVYSLEIELPNGKKVMEKIVKQ